MTEAGPPSRTEAQQAAADWHGGQCSALYGFASSGRIPCRARALREIQRARGEVNALISVTRPGEIVDVEDDATPHDEIDDAVHSLNRLEQWLIATHDTCANSCDCVYSGQK